MGLALGKLKELNDIVVGWKNVIFTDKEVEKMAFERAQICAACPFNKNSVCTKCHCPLAAKTRSPKSKCPEGKW